MVSAISTQTTQVQQQQRASSSAAPKFNLSRIAKAIMLGSLAMTGVAADASRGSTLRGASGKSLDGPKFEPITSGESQTCAAFDTLDNGKASQFLSVLRENSALCRTPDDMIRKLAGNEEFQGLVDEVLENHGRKLDADRGADNYLDFARNAFTTSIGALGVNLSDVSIQAAHDALVVSIPAIVNSLIFAARAASGDNSLQGIKAATDEVGGPVIQSLVEAGSEAFAAWSETSADGSTEKNAERAGKILKDALQGADFGFIASSTEETLTAAKQTLGDASTTLGKVDSFLDKTGNLDVDAIGSESVTLLKNANSVFNAINGTDLQDVNWTQAADALGEFINFLSEFNASDINGLLRGSNTAIDKTNTVLDSGDNFVNNTDRKLTAITVMVCVACTAVTAAALAVYNAANSVDRAANAVNQVSTDEDGLVRQMTELLGQAREAMEAGGPAALQALNGLLQTITIAIGENVEGVDPVVRQRGENLGAALESMNAAVGTVATPYRALVQPATAVAAYVTAMLLDTGRTLMAAVGPRQPAPDAGIDDPGPIPDMRGDDRV